jgi:hypothetical protein
MKISNRYQRTVAVPPERIAALVSDFDRVWPAEIAPAPRLQGRRLYDAGLMLWDEVGRGGKSWIVGVPRVPSGWSGRMGCRQSTGSSWSLQKARRLFATPSRAGRSGSRRRSGVSGSSRFMT